MNNNIFTINSLDNKKTIAKRRMQTLYQKIYRICIDDIKKNHKFGKQQLIFSVPHQIMNEHDYNRDDCADYIVDLLTKGDFIVKYNSPADLVIRWKEQNSQKTEKNKQKNAEKNKYNFDDSEESEESEESSENVIYSDDPENFIFPTFNFAKYAS